jgi:Ice-binding-like
MKLFKTRSTARLGSAAPAVWVVLAAAIAIVALATTAQAAATAVPLRTARPFAVLAGSGITNTGATTISGDIGTFPTTTITGRNTITLNGTNHRGDAVTQKAKTDLVTAFKNAAGQGPTKAIAGGQLGGRTLRSGVYNSGSSIGLTGTLILDGRGNPDAVFIFQAGSTLTTAPASQIALVNGARSCNVFWEIGSSATLDTTSNFRGTILARTSITANTGAMVHGRLLARNGAVTLDSNTITTPTCRPAPAPTPRPTSSPRPTASPSSSPTPNPTPTVVNPNPKPSPPRNSFGLTG